MGRNNFAHHGGDAGNEVLAAAAYNFHLLLIDRRRYAAGTCGRPSSSFCIEPGDGTQDQQEHWSDDGTRQAAFPQ
jgi:hypothetical protein